VNDTGPVRQAFPSEPPFDRIVAAFTTRNMRKRNIPSENLNPSLHTGDDPVKVLENRRLIFGTLGLEFESFTAAQQVHGDNVFRVTEKERGRGANSYDDAIPATDALITNVPGIPIGVFTADCVPIFLYDPEQMAVGIVHAGWRSTVKSIAFKAVGKMREEFGSKPADMWAELGPSIGPCCYEVDRDVFDEFSDGFRDASSLFAQTKRNKWHLNLWLANRNQLEESGLRNERINENRICSACNVHEYFSARRSAEGTGRTLSLIAIKPSESEV
jgi:YfiH family protein